MTISASDVSDTFLSQTLDMFDSRDPKEVEGMLYDIYRDNNTPVSEHVARKLLQIVITTLNTELERLEGDEYE